MTGSGSFSQSITNGGHAQAIPNPTNFSSRSLQKVVSAVYANVIPISFSAANYLNYIPAAAIIDSVNFYVTTTFTSGATISVGSANSAGSTPTAPTVTNVGTAGSTSYGYKVSAYVPATGWSVASSAGSTSTGNATLSATNSNALALTAVTGATLYAIYRTVGGTLGLIGTTTSLTFSDTGFVSDATKLAPTASDIVNGSASTSNILIASLVPFSNAPVQASPQSGIIGVQQVVVSLTGTTATAGVGIVVVKYINTVTPPLGSKF